MHALHVLYTIGHSTHAAKDFVQLLRSHRIDTLVDVRSAPYSKFVPQYNQPSLHAILQQQRIRYVFMGDVLGARHSDPRVLFANGKVDFQKVRATDAFQQGIARLENGLQRHRIALMCSEKEAFDCHRFGLISADLSERGVQIQHIYPDKLRSQQQLEQRLLEKYASKLPVVDLFNGEMTDNARLKHALGLRNQDIAYQASV